MAMRDRVLARTWRVCAARSAHDMKICDPQRQEELRLQPRGLLVETSELFFADSHAADDVLILHEKLFQGEFRRTL